MFGGYTHPARLRTPVKAPPEEPVSTRLVALKEKLAAGDSAALQKFREEVEKQVTPLVEPIADDTRYCHVTFLWRTKDVVKNVAVQIGMGNPRLDKNQLQRLGDTDLCYRTFRLPNDIRYRS